MIIVLILLSFLLIVGVCALHKLITTLSNSNRDVLKLHGNVIELNNKIEAKDLIIRNMENDYQGQIKEIVTLNEGMAQLKNQMMAVEGVIDEKNEEIKRLEESISLTNEKLKTASSEYSNLKTSKKSWDEKMRLKNEELQSMKNLMEKALDDKKKAVKEMDGYKLKVREAEALISGQRTKLADKEKQISTLTSERDTALNKAKKAEVKENKKSKN